MIYFLYGRCRFPPFGGGFFCPQSLGAFLRPQKTPGLRKIP
jgi:hypothetical protein